MGVDKMNIVICDDDINIRTKINEFIKEYDGKEYNFNIYEFESGEKLIESLDQELNADLVFLDIEMDKIDGIDTAKFIKIKNHDSIVIFVSSYKERVFDTFECEPFNFIVKPLNKERFESIFEKGLKKYKLLHKYFMITWENENIKMPVEQIKFFESYRKHIIFHTYDGEYKMVAKLSDTLSKLQHYGFIQTHQGYVVNMNLIKRFDEKDIILVDGTKVPISQRKRASVLKAYAQYVTRCKI